MMRKLTPYNVVKGIRYLRHFGPKEFWAKLRERMEPDTVPYGPWYEAYRPTAQELDRQRERKWKEMPSFAVIVPVFNTPQAYLDAMIESVRAQTYPAWQLYLVNASPENEGLKRQLEKAALSDSRIHVIPLPVNGGIAANTNAGLAAAKGDFVCFLDHDDVLDESALYHLADAACQNPLADVMYTDEDKIDETGREHFDPNLKPDFNPDLLRSNNYICHFLAVRRTLLDQTGMFRKGFDGAQDYDFILRCTEKARQVVHVPEILYHWRTHSSSTADNPLSKAYAYEAGRKAIEEHLHRCKCPAVVSEKKDPGFYRVRYEVTGNPLVSIIIPNRDETETLRQCLDSILQKSTYANIEILIVENNSVTDEIFAYYRQLESNPSIRVLTWEGTFNYAAINNFAARQARGEYLLFLNNDTRVITPAWIEEMLGVCERPDVGAVGAKLYYPDDTIQHAGIAIGIGGVAGSLFTGLKREYSGYMHKASLTQDLSAVTAACMMMPSDLFSKLGGFEEKLTVAFNDVDLCLRVSAAGYLVVYHPYAELYHDESKTRGAEDSKEKVRRFQHEIEFMRSRWTSLLKAGDPYLNPHFSRSSWMYVLKPGDRMQ